MEQTLALALELLEKIEQSDDGEQYRLYRDQLYALGMDIVPVLRENLQHPSPKRRMAAATNLGRLGQRDAAALLVPLLSDAHSEVREMALFSLGLIGDASLVEPIVEATQDYDADVRYRALIALGDLQYANLEDILIEAMEDESYGVREQAMSQLSSMGTVKALPVILKALLEREHDMHQLAEAALDRLIPKMTREQYKKLNDRLSPRERRLILNHLESRNLQEVYSTLWHRLQLIPRGTNSPRGLDKFGRLLNESDEMEFLQRAYGREDIVTLLVDHFSDSNTRRSILLVGDAGAGKTAIIHEMTRQLAGEENDENWKILETNTSELMSGTRYLGDWETKLKELSEAVLNEENVILYITNPNDLLGAGAHSKSDENFADFFKPYLQRGQIRIIAECTDEDLKKGLGRDPGFLRQFKQVKVPTMSRADSLEVLQQRLKGMQDNDAINVQVEPGCLEQIIEFSEAFYTRNAFPGRACDLLDALLDFTGKSRDVNDAKELFLRTRDIPACLSEVTGISLDLLDDSIPLDLSEMRQWFLERLIDQDHAIDAIVDRLALIKSGMGDPDKPLTVSFLVGPTGVGKTYFTKLVARRLFGSEERMVRFDLSEYQGRFAIEKLIGSPYEQDREGLLTEAVRNQPYCVLLFDEFEKADPDVYNLFLQILDEGRLTDARGRTTDFRQTLIFLTSNLGASRTSIAPVGFDNRQLNQSRSDHIRAKLEEVFAPEFLNRLDDILVFTPLSTQAMAQLVEIELDKAFDRRGFKQRNLSVKVTRSAHKWLEEHGFSNRFGARELKRSIEKNILTAIGRLLVTEPGPHDGKTVVISVSGGEINVAIEAASESSIGSKSMPGPDKRSKSRKPTLIDSN